MAIYPENMVDKPNMSISPQDNYYKQSEMQCLCMCVFIYVFILLIFLYYLFVIICCFLWGAGHSVYFPNYYKDH